VPAVRAILLGMGVRWGVEGEGGGRGRRRGRVRGIGNGWGREEALFDFGEVARPDLEVVRDRVVGMGRGGRTTAIISYNIVTGKE